jgi:ATP-dependent protease ClpP protease subunit
MKGILTKIIVLLSVALPAVLVCCANGDVFVSKNGEGNRFTGYRTGKIVNGQVEISTGEGRQLVNIELYETNYSKKGRNDFVSLVKIEGDIVLHMDADAIEEALLEEAAKGPLFILLQIDSPGGRVDLAKQLCSAVLEVSENCPVVGYISGGECGGAYSAAAALALACNEIYMSHNTVIGAATIMSSVAGTPVELKSLLGETVGEKVSSAWRNYLASLAENRGRPALLARAMEDRNIIVIEVAIAGERNFVEPVNVPIGSDVVKTWSQSGSLLTLTAHEAVHCGMAEGCVDSIGQLLVERETGNAAVKENEGPSEAKRQYKQIKRKIMMIDASIDKSIKMLNATQSRPQALKAMRSLIRDAKFILYMKNRFGDDLQIDERKIREFLNAVEANYEAAFQQQRSSMR